jgi:hypothetical protein
MSITQQLRLGKCKVSRSNTEISTHDWDLHEYVKIVMATKSPYRLLLWKEFWTCPCMPKPIGPRTYVLAIFRNASAIWRQERYVSRMSLMVSERFRETPIGIESDQNGPWHILEDDEKYHKVMEWTDRVWNVPYYFGWSIRFHVRSVMFAQRSQWAILAWVMRGDILSSRRTPPH